jgi:hypothetical protein
MYRRMKVPEIPAGVIVYCISKGKFRLKMMILCQCLSMLTLPECTRRSTDSAQINPIKLANFSGT